MAEWTAEHRSGGASKLLATDKAALLVTLNRCVHRPIQENATMRIGYRNSAPSGGS
jgi:hypothetical protein